MLKKKNRQKTNESLPEHAKSIRHLVDLAYPIASEKVNEILNKDQFVDALTIICDFAFSNPDANP